MTKTDEVLEALRDDGYSVFSEGHAYRITRAGRTSTTELFIEDASVDGFIAGGLADGQFLWPDVPAEVGAFRLLLTNVFEGIDTSDRVVVTASGVEFTPRPVL